MKPYLFSKRMLKEGKVIINKNNISQIYYLVKRRTIYTMRVLFFKIFLMPAKNMKGTGKKISFLRKIFCFKGFFGNLVWKIDISDKPLNWLSIVFLVAFDIFIFVNLLNGLENQRENITSPYVKYNYKCIDAFHGWEKLSYNDFVTVKNHKDFYTKGLNKNAPFYSDSFRQMDSDTFCIELHKYVVAIQKDSQFTRWMDRLDSIMRVKGNYERQKNNYERDYENFREDYKAWLWDYNNRISDINNDNIRGDYNRILDSIADQERQESDQIHSLNLLSWVQNLKSYIDKNKKVFQESRDNYVFWYPVYITLMEMVLILPIFFVALFLYNFALNRKKRILSILASNLSLLSGIFVFYILIKVIYWLLPKKFLVNIFEYLASIKLLAVWNYLLVIFGILLFGFLMFISQRALEKWKKIKEEQAKEKERLYKDSVQKARFWKGLCIECDTKLPDGALFCGNCWAAQYRDCKSCKSLVPKIYKYCNKCGK